MRTERGRKIKGARRIPDQQVDRRAGRLFLSISHPLAHSLAFMRKIGAQLWPLDLLLQDGVAPKAPLSNKLDMQQKGLPSCSPCLRKPRKEPIIPADPVPLYVRIKSDTRGEWVVRVGRPTTSGFGIPSCHAGKSRENSSLWNSRFRFISIHSGMQLWVGG